MQVRSASIEQRLEAWLFLGDLALRRVRHTLFRVRSAFALTASTTAHPAERFLISVLGGKHGEASGLFSSPIARGYERYTHGRPIAGRRIRTDRGAAEGGPLSHPPPFTCSHISSRLTEASAPTHEPRSSSERVISTRGFALLPLLKQQLNSVSYSGHIGVDSATYKL